MIDWSFFFETLGRLADGIPLTANLAATSLACGFGLAVLLAAMRRGPAWLGWPARGYVFVFRGTPLLVQIYLIYYAPGQFAWVRGSAIWPFLREPYGCALLSLSLATAAYGSEVIRGGLDGVPRGLIEAGQALGLRRLAVLRHIILPLAARIALPAYGNEMILMVKATSLASVVTLMEVTGITYRIISETYRVLPVIAAAGVIYLSMNLLIVALIDQAASRLDRRVGKLA